LEPTQPTQPQTKHTVNTVQNTKKILFTYNVHYLEAGGPLQLFDPRFAAISSRLQSWQSPSLHFLGFLSLHVKAKTNQAK